MKLSTYSDAKKLGLEFLESLGVTEITYFGLPAVRMSYRDADGNECAVRIRRALNKCDGKDDRFCWEAGANLCLYGLPQLRPGKESTIVEGESDTQTLLLHNINAVGVPGAGCYNDDRDSPHLLAYEIIYLPVEPDRGGQTLLKKLSESVLRDRIRIVPLGPFKDVSEMYLDDPERFQERWRAAVDRAQPLAAAIESSPTHETLLQPFDMTPDGLFAHIQVGGETQQHWLSGPFEVLGLSRDPDSNSWGSLIRFKDDDGHTHECLVANALLHGDVKALCSNLASQGLRITTVARDRSHLVRYLNEVPVAGRIILLHRTGWHEIKGRSVFALPNGSLGAPEGEIVHYDGGPHSPYHRSGTLGEWKDAVGRHAGQHSRLILLCSMAFAGPLLDPVGHDGGGLHLYGNSTTGKTTAGRVAGSVWGKGGSPGYVLPWRHTSNAFEAILSERTDTLVIFDEVGLGEAQALSTAVYQITAQRGKLRLDRNSQLRSGTAWRTVLISTGEVPIGVKIAEEHGQRHHAGQQVRILDIPADSGSGCGIFDAAALEQDPGVFADALRESAAKFYGVAGPAFVSRVLAEGPQDVGALAREMMARFGQAQVPAGADGQVRRAAGLLGLIGAAGELATAWDIVPWQPGTAMESAAQALKDWIAQRGGLASAEERDGIEQVRLYLAKYGESRFDPVEGAVDRSVNVRAGWRRGTGESREWLVPASSFRNEMCAGRDATAIARVLATRGMLLRDGQGKYSRSERTPLGQMRVYVLTAVILKESSDDS